MRKLLLTAAAAMAFSAPATAADLPMTVPAFIPPPAVFDWSGFYVGAHIGYSWMDGDVRVAFGPLGATTGISSSGFIGGLHLGFNLQSGNVVYGIEADVNYAEDPTGSFILFTNALANFDSLRGFAGVDWSGSLRGRLGWAFDRTLVYVTGGVAIGAAETRLAYHAADGNLVVGANRRDTLVGWTIGAGAAYALTDNLSLRIEYRYTDFGSIDVGILVPNPAVVAVFPPIPASSRTDITTHDVRLGLTYRFSAPPAPVQARF